MRIKRIKQISYSVLLLLLLLLPFILRNNYYQQVANMALINAIVVLGLNFTTGLTGQMMLGLSGVFAIGAYTEGILLAKLGWSFFPCLLMAILFGCIISLVLGFPSLRLRGIYMAIVTIGFGEIVRLSLNNLTELTGGSIGLRNVGGIKLWEGFTITGRVNMYYFILIFFFFFLWVAWKIAKSPIGMSLLSIKDNELAAGTLGIDISKQKLLAFTFCCVFTSVAGVLYAATLGFLIPYDFNYDMSVRFVMMLVIGGITTVGGSILGAIIITVLPEALRFLQNFYWILFGIVTILMVVLHPKGLVAIPFTIGNMIKERQNRKTKEGSK